MCVAYLEDEHEVVDLFSYALCGTLLYWIFVQSLTAELNILMYDSVFLCIVLLKEHCFKKGIVVIKHVLPFLRFNIFFLHDTADAYIKTNILTLPFWY